MSESKVLSLWLEGIPARDDVFWTNGITLFAIDGDEILAHRFGDKIVVRVWNDSFTLMRERSELWTFVMDGNMGFEIRLMGELGYDGPDAEGVWRSMFIEVIRDFENGLTQLKNCETNFIDKIALIHSKIDKLSEEFGTDSTRTMVDDLRKRIELVLRKRGLEYRFLVGE